MDRNVADWLHQQFQAFESKSGLREYYTELFGIIDSELGDAISILELGSGIGIARDLLPNRRIQTSDAVPTPYADAVIDAESLPHDDASLDAVFAVDVLHHVPRPTQALREAVRVLRVGGRLILVEPYASPLSRIVYAALHPEPVNLKVDVWADTPLTSNDLMDANQAIATLMFHRDLSRMPADLRRCLSVRTRLHSLVSFPATGGINHQLGLPQTCIRALLAAERRAPQWLLRLAAMRTFIVVTRRC